MNFEDLVRAITEKVLAELRAAGHLPAVLSSRSVLVLAAPGQNLDFSAGGSLRACLGQNVSLEFFQGAEAAQKADRYVMPSLCCSDMAALAAGRATGPVTHKVLELLLAGETVEVLEFEYLRHVRTAPPALYNLYAAYEKKLAAFGLIKFEEPSADRIKLREGLITEKSVKEAGISGVKILSVPSGAIVTALAKDAAKEQGIEIVKDSEI